MEQNESYTNLNSDIKTSDTTTKEENRDILEVEALSISEKEPDSSSRSTWYTKKPRKLEKSESIEVLDYKGCEENKLLRSPLKAARQLNGSTPQLTFTLSDPSSRDPESSTPTASPQGSPKFVKLRNRTAPSSAFQRRAEKAASVYGDKAHSTQKKQRPRSSIFGSSAIMRRPARNSLHATNLTLLSILDNKKMKAAFLDFLESEYSSENLRFWLSCEKYKKLKSEEQRSREGQYVYSQYICPNAPHQVNIDHIMRRQITMVVMGDDPFPLELFDSAKRYVFSIMENDSFPRFLTSSFYKDALSGRKSPFESVISNFLPGSWNSNSTKSQSKNANNNNLKADVSGQITTEKDKTSTKVTRRFSFGLKKNPSIAVSKESRSSAPELSTEQFIKLDVKIS